MLETKMRVLVISPQHWGIMRVSKHHYAIELAKLGHEVYFLEPLEPSWRLGSTSFTSKATEYPNLKVLSHTIFAPYNLKFHAKKIFDLFMKSHIRKMEKTIGCFDLVWSFDLTGTISLKYFNAETFPTETHRRRCRQRSDYFKARKLNNY
jgi:hypothetical protein